MDIPVIVHITIVSINVPVIDTSPWRTGSFVCAAAAAIGAEPSPASFENMPRAMPFCIATVMLPTIPPVTAAGLKAPLTISTIAPGTAVMFVTTSKSADNMYTAAMNGTITCDTLAILLMPPITTRATHNVTRSPAITTEIE